MKLVETDIPHGDEEVADVPRPPRPERRRTYVSLGVTLTVLAATVIAVYVAFPKRDNEVLTAATDAHREGGPFELERPSVGELAAWSVGAVGNVVPWVAPDEARGIRVIGTRSMRILRRPAALVRYRLGGGDDGASAEEVSLVVMRARDAPPRTYRRVEGGDLAVSWRKGAWTFVAVGSEASAERWRETVGVP